MRPYSCLMYVGLCIRIPLLCIFVSIRLIYVIHTSGSLLCMWTCASVFLYYVGLCIVPCYVCGSIHLLCICVYMVNICDSMSDPCYVCGPMRPYSCLMYVGLCIRIPCYAFVYTVNICDSMRPDPCYVCGPMRPYSCLMYVGLCIRIPLLCICVYTVNICDSMRPDPCYVCGPMRPYSCLMYVGLCIRIPLLCICVYTVNICDSMRPDPCYVCGPMRPYFVLCMWVMHPYPLVMHLCLYG
ncbi:unnamed protein product [Acanthosepion pharaonis]|uniref:Uncharacterized protein n=1 Tax=Acanthosepion pharaonis TaxID=158019 RepID=A0A812BHM3_ACAPH|nr:unnamed protein product [Sepia pharaonis]